MPLYSWILILTAIFWQWACSSSEKAEHYVVAEKDAVAPKPNPKAKTPVPSGPVATLQLEVKLDPYRPHNEWFRGAWRIGVHNIDDHGRPSTPTWYGNTDYKGQADISLPAFMFKQPMLITAINVAHPLLSGPRALRTLKAFLPANCNIKRITVDPFADASWRYSYSLAARRGAYNWTPSNVDCALLGKSGALLRKTPEVVDAMRAISRSRNMTLALEPLILASQRYTRYIFKTRPPLCFPERRHSGGGMREGEIITPLDALDDSEERFIHQFSDPAMADDSAQFYGGLALAAHRRGNTASVGENGLLRTLCANANSNEIPPVDKTMFFRPSLIINGQSLALPDTTYDLDDRGFYGHIASFVDPPLLENLSIKTYTVRQTNGFEKDHDKYTQVCSATILTTITNTSHDEQDIEVGSGLIFEDLFDQSGSGVDENPELGPNNTDAVVLTTSSGNRSIEEEDRWAIIFDADAIAIPGNLLGLCNPHLFCSDTIPNFSPARIQEALVVELLGHRKGDFRDDLEMSFDEAQENLFIGLRADHELRGKNQPGDESNFMTTLTYINQKNVQESLALCYEAADFLTRQHIDVVSIEEGPIVAQAAVMIARSRCFSNSLANQRWQNYNVGLWTMNGHKGVNPNLLIPMGWTARRLFYDVFIKKFDESVFRGPVASFMPDPYGGEALEIPTLSEGDEILFAAEHACCQDYQVSVPCAAGPPAIPVPGVPVVLDTTGRAMPAAPPPPPPPFSETVRKGLLEGRATPKYFGTPLFQ